MIRIFFCLRFPNNIESRQGGVNFRLLSFFLVLWLWGWEVYPLPLKIGQKCHTSHFDKNLSKMQKKFGLEHQQ